MQTNPVKSYPKPDLDKARFLDRMAALITGVVFITVGLMRRIKFDTGVDFDFLPPVIAVLNTLVAVSLIVAVYHVRRKDIINHRKYILVAMVLSALFLVCYVVYHFTTPETTYCRQDWTRGLYYALLISHIILAGISLPFILFTFVRGYTYQVKAHTRLARWVFPIWLYVAVSGPLCYLMLKPCYI